MKRVWSIGAVLLMAGPAFAQEDAPATTQPQTEQRTGPGPSPSAVRSNATTAAPRTPTELNQGLVLDARPGLGATTGLFRNAQATGQTPGTFGLSLMTEFYRGADTVRQGDDARRFIGHLGFTWTPIDHLEVFTTLSARATTNTLGRPELIQSVGDLSLGAKGFGEVAPGIHLGGLLRLNFPAGANQVGFDFGAMGVDILALFTADLRTLADAPVRLHLNVGYLVDRSANLFPFALERVERFGHNIYDYNRVHLGFGVDVPLDYVTPSLEWTTQFPTGAACNSEITQPCVTDNGFSAYPSWVTLGLASAPFANGIAMHAGMDIGVTTAESQGTPAVPAWNLLLGLSYHLDPRGRAAAAPVVAAAEPAELRSYVRGRVVDATTGAPIAGARITYRGTDYSAQVTDDDGTFRSIDFEVGTEVLLEVAASEYTGRTMRMTISEEIREGTIELQQDFTGARVTGTVRSTSVSSVDAVLEFRGPDNERLDVSGEYSIDLTPGEYIVTASAAGHISSRQRIVFSAGRRDFSAELRPLPPGMSYRITGTAIELDDPEKRIAFENGELTPDASALLDQLAQLLQADTTIRITIIAHTDDNEYPAAEAALTETRAQAVRDALMSRGIAADRLQARGAGASEPKYPNVSDRNRRRNNRVEFELR